MKKWIIAVVVMAMAVAGGVIWWRSRTPPPPQYRTVTLEQGSIIQSVRATGTVRPRRLVEVGTQVNGPIEKLYVDFNDQVKAGDLVAQIDPRVYKARLEQEQANLLQSEAAVDQARARLDQADKNLVRARELSRRDMISMADLDAAVAERETLAAQLKVAQASVAQSRAALQMAEANLGYTVIRSPVDGVVIDRSVSEGQTVVASMTAKTLFMIATDLSEVDIEANIPEADIGSVKAGQTVVFTVDAFAETFTGQVSQIRMAARTAQSVVTYPVIVQASNPGRKLFPGMTANITCEVARQDDVLKIPSGALRYRPAAEKAAGRGGRGEGSRLWVLKDGKTMPEPVRVELGISDGAYTALKHAPAGIVAGTEVVVGTNVTGAVKEMVNPFAPKIQPQPGRRR